VRRLGNCRIERVVYTFWVESLRPLLAALLLPPLPFVALLACALVVNRRHPGAARVAFAAGIVGVWVCSCVGTSEILATALLRIPAPLSDERILELKRLNEQHPGQTAIIMLGSGIVQNSVEYREARLSSVSLERLRYGLWLSGRTGIPAGFSGGVGWAGESGDSEAATAQRIATREFQLPLAWVEGKSRDTIENAERSVEVLTGTGIRHIVVVTSGLHMQRAIAAFEKASAGKSITLEPASMNLALRTDKRMYAWIPSPEGYGNVYVILREWLGRLLCA
jgi:uncharacterized SAM-binding protein YcdF (DUF218 family)